MKRLMTAIVAEFAPSWSPTRHDCSTATRSCPSPKGPPRTATGIRCGIVGFSVDDQLNVAAFGLSGAVGIATWIRPAVTWAQLLDVTGPAIDPQWTLRANVLHGSPTDRCSFQWSTDLK